MRAMWSSGRARSTPERRRSGDDPPSNAHCDRKTKQRSPPFAGTHRFDARLNLSPSCKHWLDQADIAKTGAVIIGSSNALDILSINGASLDLTSTMITDVEILQAGTAKATTFLVDTADLADVTAITGSTESRQFQIFQADAPKVWGIAIGTRNLERAHERCVERGIPCTEPAVTPWGETRPDYGRAARRMSKRTRSG